MNKLEFRMDIPAVPREYHAYTYLRTLFSTFKMEDTAMTTSREPTGSDTLML